MGDHAKPGGWNDIILDQIITQKRAEAEAKGDYGASSHIRWAEDWVDLATNTGHLRRAFSHMENAAILAKKEAEYEGVNINGWDADVHHGEPEPFEVIRTRFGANFADTWLSNVPELPPALKYVAGLFIEQTVEVKPLRISVGESG